MNHNQQSGPEKNSICSCFPTLRLFMVLLLACMICACAKPPVKKPLPEQPLPPSAPEQKQGVPEQPIPPTQQEAPEVSTFEILLAEAEKFITLNNYEDALFVYNQAYAIADSEQLSVLTPRVETLLSKTPSMVIKNFIQRPNISMEPALLQYYLGLKLAFENSKAEAKLVLDDFIRRFPFHRYGNQARAMLGIVHESLFDANAIGCILPLSGKYAVFGQKALAGIQLAVSELAKQYDRPFQIYIEDSQADPVVAKAAVRRLYEKNVAAIIGPLLPVTQAGVEAEILEIPLIALTQKDDFSFQGEYLFANFITPQMQVRTLAAYLFGELGLTTAAILYPDEPYGKKYMHLFWDIAEEYGVEIRGVEAYDGKATDFTTPIQKLSGRYFDLPDFLKPESQNGADGRAALSVDDLFEDLEQENGLNPRAQEETPQIELDFEVIFIPDAASRIKLILPQLAFNDVTDILLAGTNLWHHKSLLKKTIQKYSKNAVITDGFFINSTNAATTDFAGKFKALFNRDPQFIEAIAFDCASFVYKTAMQDGVNTHQALKSALQGQSLHDGATGITLFDTDGNTRRQLFLITVKKGRFVEVRQ